MPRSASFPRDERALRPWRIQTRLSPGQPLVCLNWQACRKGAPNSEYSAAYGNIVPSEYDGHYCPYECGANLGDTYDDFPWLEPSAGVDMSLASCGVLAWVRFTVGLHDL